MPIPHQPRTLPRFWTLLALLLASGPSLAQPSSPAELRRKIDELQAENVRLASELQALTLRLQDTEAQRELERARAGELERQVAKLLDELSRSSGPIPQSESGPSDPTPTSVPTNAPIPADPLASPASLLAELQRRYAADLTPSDSSPTDPAAPLAADRRRQIDQWCAEQSSLLQGPVEWRVRFTDFREAARRDYRARLTVIDPASGLPVGDSIDVAVPRTLADRLERELTLGRDPDKAPLWTLVGALAAAPKLNPDRPTPGVFNHPAFVGPFVEFDFHLNWRSLTVLPESP